MKNGFTLVELSIVLVIIGLLIGGILVGQSLIESAKINKFTNTITQYDIALTQFKNKFKQLPGDTAIFPIAGYANPRIYSNNGAINALSSSSSTGRFEYEAAYYWKHLYQAGMIPRDYNANANTGIRADINIPKTPYPGVGLFAGTYENFTYNNVEVVYFIGDTSATISRFNFNEKNFATPILAMAIDKKLDDGKAYPTAASSVDASYNGRFVKLFWYSRSSNPCTVSEEPGNPQSENFSMLNPTEKNCVAMYRIDITQ